MSALRGPSTPNKWITLVVLSLGVSLIVIDGTIVNVALPVIIRDLQLTFTDAEWVNTIYTLIFAALLITAGRLGDRLGRRMLFAVGVGVFVIGSLLAARADASTSLIWARVVQGVGGALILPCTLSTVNATFRGRDRAIAFGVWGSVISGMAALGPLLGGVLTTSFSWRWIFLINVPLGVLLLVGIALFVPETKGSDFSPGLDVDGFLLSALGLGCLVFGLVEGRNYGWWRPVQDVSLMGVHWRSGAPLSPAALSLMLGVVLLGLFVLWERHRARVNRSALIKLSLFNKRSFRWGNTAALIIALGEFGLLFTLPLYLQNVLSLSALGSGAVLAAMAGGAFVAGGAAGELARRLAPATVASLGLAIEVVALVVLAAVVHPSSRGWVVALVLLAYGAGLGLCSAQLTSVVLSEVPPGDSGQGSAVQSTGRQLGSALGVAILGTVLASGVAAFASGSLAGVAGLSPSQGHRLESTLGPSAGGIITQIRLGQVQLPAGTTDAVVTALSGAFTNAARIAIFGAAVVLALGFLVTLRLPRAKAARSSSAGR